MSTSNPEIKYALNSDKSGVAISFNGNEVTFATADFERLLGWLGTIRSQMEPAVPTEIEQGLDVYQATHLFMGHRKGLPSAPTESGAVIAVRSDYFGWLEFNADPEFCRGMMSWLLSPPDDQVVEPTATPQ